MHDAKPPVESLATIPAGSGDDLKRPSLVFVRSQSGGGVGSNPQPAIEEQQISPLDVLPAGTRLIARLQAPVSTAVQAPAVAVIEYNYESDGRIIVPAGTQVIGKLQNANGQGYISLHFDELQMREGSSQKIDAVAMGLDYKPLKGNVSGRNRGLKFLVQSLTGIGESAAYVAGPNGSALNAPFSESALLRERLANNVAIAGQNEFNQLALNQNLVVTLAGNTRFYLVLEKGSSAGTPTPASSRTTPSTSVASLPSVEELRQLLELRGELNQMYQQVGNTSSVGGAAQTPRP